jgi:hypothetical protein
MVNIKSLINIADTPLPCGFALFFCFFFGLVHHVYLHISLVPLGMTLRFHFSFCAAQMILY